MPPELMQLLSMLNFGQPQQQLDPAMTGTQDFDKLGSAFGLGPGKLHNLLQTTGKKDNTTAPQQIPNLPQVGNAEFDPNSILRSIPPPPPMPGQPPNPQQAQMMGFHQQGGPPMPMGGPPMGPPPTGGAGGMGQLPPELLQMLFGGKLPPMNFGG